MRRLAISILAALAMVALLAPAAGAKVRIVAPSSVRVDDAAHFGATAPSATERVVFFVDGRRRWVDRSPGWSFGRDGAVRLGAGRHLLEVRAVEPHRTLTTRKVTDVSSLDASVATGTAQGTQRQPQSQQASAPSSTETGTAAIDAGFEEGLANWNIAGVGEVVPRIESEDVRTGTYAARFLLTGLQNRSELSLGGTGSDDDSGMAHFGEGAEYWYGFSFNIQQMVYGHPGAHNLIMQFKSEGTGSPNFGLQLWDYAGDDGHSGGRGLWSHGDAMGGDRFLAPVSERSWHDVAIHFRASSSEAGFYEVFLDGALVDSRNAVSMIVPGKSYAYIKTGIYRNGETIPGTSEVLVDSARLGSSDASVRPG